MGHEKGALPSRTAPTNLLALDEEGMGRLVQQFGWPRYRTGQILRWLYQRRAKDVNQMTDLGQAERTALASRATIPRAAGCTVFRSIDHTRKLVLTLNDGLTVETVLIPDEDRLTLCVSTQVGCTLDCGFCLTGTMGLKRNLRPHEIMEQVLTAQDRLVSVNGLPTSSSWGWASPWPTWRPCQRPFGDSPTNRGDSDGRPDASRSRLPASRRDLKILRPRRQSGHLAECHTEDQRDSLMPAVNGIASLKTLLAACRQYPFRRPDDSPSSSAAGRGE